MNPELTLQGSEAGVQSTPNRDAAPERVCTWKDGQAFSMPCVFFLPLTSVLALCFFMPFVPSNQPSFSSFPSTTFVPVFLCFPSLPSIPSFLPWCLHLFQVLLCTFNLDVPHLISHDSSHFAKTCQNYHVMENAKDKPCGGTHSNSWSPQDVSIGWWPISMKHRVSPFHPGLFQAHLLNSRQILPVPFWFPPRKGCHTAGAGEF